MLVPRQTFDFEACMFFLLFKSSRRSTEGGALAFVPSLTVELAYVCALCSPVKKIFSTFDTYSVQH